MSSKEEIFDYVMETPQNTNPAILKDLLKDLPSSDLPDPSTLTDGAAIVVVNGEWKTQEGYGYIEQGEQTVITWDGDIQGRERVPAFFVYKVSNKIITQSDVIGGEYGYAAGITIPITEGRIFDLASEGIENAFGITFEEGELNVAIMCVQNDTVFGDIPVSAGVYFQYADTYISSLTYSGDTVHQFDPALVPSVVPAAPSEDGQYFLTCAVTDGEAVYSWETME